MKKSIVTKIKSGPKEPGIYIFYSKNKALSMGNQALYIGKASNLRNRLRSYLKVTDLKTQSLNNEADKLEYIILRSEIEALIEESRLIKELKPKYNILWMDDKSYHYVAFTKEKFPKIFITHHSQNSQLIGPFTDGAALRQAMKIIRRYFPYCTCLRPHFRDCLNAQIGRCFGYCCKKGVLTRQHINFDYQRNIKMIKTILRGQSKKLLKFLKDEKEKQALEKIIEHRDFVRIDRNDQNVQNKINNSIIEHSASNIQRIECYDISNLSGKETVGAMTVLNKNLESKTNNYDWQPDKNSYRRFKIKFASKRDDPRMIAEILERRLNHPEWPYPDLIIIDGGITQYRAAKLVISSKLQVLSSKIKLISFSKPHKFVYGWKENSIPISELSQEIRELIERAIYQTHNFVIRYHRQVRSRGMLKLNYGQH